MLGLQGNRKKNWLLDLEKYWEKSTKLFKCMAGYCREEGNSQLSASLEKRTGHKLLRQKPDLRKTVGDSF